MANVIACDGGCGFVSPDPAEFQGMGVVAIRHYCPACAPKAQAFLDARDDAHAKAAEAFQRDHAKLTARAKAGFRLPDHG